MRPSKTSRRAVLSAGVAGFGATLAGCLGGDGDDGPTIGIIEDRSGDFALTGTPKWQASTLAIEEINDEGGILGEEIEIFDPDPQSDNSRYQELIGQAIEQENVDALWAGISSASREAIRPTINQHDQLYFYTTQYEGGVCDRTTFPVGATARQQLDPVIQYMIEEFGTEIYVIAADYNFGQISGAWTEVIAEENGAEVVGEEYIPLSVSEFGDTINRIEGEDPDFVMSMLAGENHTSFYDQRAAAGLDIPIGSSTAMMEDYSHLSLSPPALTDVYVGFSYMEELPGEENEGLVERFHDRWEAEDAEYLNQSAYNNYVTTYMYRDAVEAAGTFDQEAVIEELRGMTYEGPVGEHEIDPATHHMNHLMYVAQADDDHNIEVVADPETIGPTFLTEEVGCDLREDPEQTQYEPEDV